MNFKKNLLIFMSLTLTLNTWNNRIQAEYPSPYSVALATLGTAVGGFGLYKLYKWYMREETNQELILNGTQALHTHKTAHRENIHALTTIFNLHIGQAYTKHDIALLSDAALYQCAVYICNNNSYNTWYLKKDIEYALSTLQQYEQKIANRCTQLLIKEQNPQEHVELTQLQHLAEQLHVIIENLVSINALYTYHGYYFEYVNTLNLISAQYNAAIELMHSPWFEHQLPRICHTNSQFPLVYYVQDLKQNIDRLYDIRAHTSMRYKTLYIQTQTSIKELEYLFNAISATETYRYQLTAYNTYLLEQERLRLERERLALQKQKLQAQQEYAHAQYLSTINDYGHNWKNCWDPHTWHTQKTKETVIYIPQTAPVVIQTPQQPQPSITINNNPVITQEVKPKVKQKPTIVQSPIITVEKKTETVEKKEEQSTPSHDSFIPITYDMNDPELELLHFYR